ncbi:MAG: hypothetical protein WBH55_12910, partial [Bacteroidota bacterium]
DYVMKTARTGSLLTSLLLSVLLGAQAFSSNEEEVLWVEVESEGSSDAIIAISIDAAELVLLEGKDELFTGKKGKIERKVEEMLVDVLEGRIEEGEIIDPEDGTTIRAHKRMLEVPGETRGGGDDAVLEIYKDGKRTFSVRIPDVTVETSSDDGDVIVESHVGWKQLLPFLAEKGGVVYIRSQGKEDTEIWLYVD